MVTDRSDYTCRGTAVDLFRCCTVGITRHIIAEVLQTVKRTVIE